jgi:hypothetical protein
VTAPAAAAGLRSDRDERAARLWDAIGEEFLAVMGWDPVQHLVTFPHGHPMLGWRKCRVPAKRAFDPTSSA